MPGENDMPVVAPFGIVEIGGNVFVRVGKALVPRTDRFLFLRENVSRPDGAERIARVFPAKFNQPARGFAWVLLSLVSAYYFLLFVAHRFSNCRLLD